MGKGLKSRKPLKPAFVTLIVAIVTFVSLFILISMGIAPERYDIKVGEVAKITITASKDVEDTVSTELLMESAERSVSASYNSDASVMPKVMEQLDQALEQIDKLPSLRMGMDGEMLQTATDSMIKEGHSVLTPQVVLEEVPVPLSDSVIKTLIEADPVTMDRLTDEVSRLVRETLNGKLLEGQEGESLLKLKRDLLAEGFSERLVNAVAQTIGHYIRPNMLLDMEATEANREKARSEVEPIIYKKGQNIVRAGEVVTEPQIAMLNNLGMLKDRVDFTLYVGIGLLLVLLSAVIGVYLYSFEREILKDLRKFILLCLICVLVVGFSLMVRQVSSYLMPVVLGAMLTTLLIKSRLAVVTNLVLSVLTGLLASADSGVFTSTMFSVILTSFISGTVCVVLIRVKKQRLSVLLAGAVAGVLNLTSTVAVALINSANLQNMLSWAGYSAGSGALSAVLCLGIQPALEWMFNLDTNAKLTDLSNPNQELLRRLMIEAPGTYHHSMIVANLSEAAANMVGANGLLARVGAYYHDIGKLKRPLYFKENQIHDNPHDRTDPRVSTAILTAHTKDGVEMAQKIRLPQAIQDIILQHHGDTPVLYFYDKAVKQGGNADIDDFRYGGPRPKSPEAAIVMLADTIEAAARAMADSTPEKIRQLIQRMVRSKIDDGQLDCCNLTLSDLNKICESFLTTLGGVYHERIEYPTVNIPERKRIDETVVEKGGKGKDGNKDGAKEGVKEAAKEKPKEQADETAQESEDEA